MLKRIMYALMASLLLVGVAGAPAQASNDWSRAAAVARANAHKGLPPVWDKSQKRYVQAGNGGGTSAKLFTLQYLYEGGGQSGLTSTAGSQANFEIPNPAPSLDTGAGDLHTLAEIATKKLVNSQWQIVEVGWNVDSGLYGNTSPHVFVGSWVNGSFKGYNSAAGSGWVDYAGTAPNAGDALTSGDIWQFRTQYSSTGSTGWWIWAGRWNGSAYVGDWMGYYPTANWSSAVPSASFTNNTDAQYFWEVLANSSTPCTDMGNGTLGTFGPPAAGNYIASTTNIGAGAPASVNSAIAIPAGYTGYNHVMAGTTRTFRGGGPGSC